MISAILKRAIHLTNIKPHTLILIYAEQNNQITQALSRRIQRELKDVNINALTTDKLISSPQVPYTVIITERTLIDGVLQLQHFTPRVSEEVHVSSVVERLLQQSGDSSYSQT